MKVLSTDGLTKLIQLIKSAFISVDDTVSTNTVTLAAVATSGSYTDLSDKPTIPSTTNLANKDLSNLSSTGEARFTAKVSISDCAEVYPVIETYVNGASWYRIYSDGWCEQGGKVTPSGSSATTSTIVYLKPFLNTNYFIVANYGSSSSNQYGQCYDLTTTQCTTKSYGGATNSWYACGQLATGQY